MRKLNVVESNRKFPTVSYPPSLAPREWVIETRGALPFPDEPTKLFSGFVGHRRGSLERHQDRLG
jgi:hypothetical protein